MGPILFAIGGNPPGVIYISHFILYLYLFYHQSSIITHHSSIISHQSSVINHQLSIINHPWSMINHQSSITSHLFWLWKTKRTSATKWVGNRIHEVLIGGIETEKWDLSLLQWFRGVIKGCRWSLWRKNMAILVVVRVIWGAWKIKIARRGPMAQTLIIWTP